MQQKSLCFYGLMLVFGLLLSGCSSNDKKEVPLKLIEFTPSVDLEKHWRAQIGKGQEKHRYTRFNMVEQDGIVYVSDYKGKIFGIDLETGIQVWRYKSKLPISGGLAIHDGRLYFGTYDAEVVVIDIAEKKEVWRVNVSSEVLSPPVTDGSIVLVQTSDSRLFALEADTGEQRWKYDHISPVLSLRTTSKPVIVSTQVVTGFDNGQIVSLSLVDGSTLWKARAAQPKGRSELDRIVDIDSYPLVSGALIYVVSYQGNIAAVNRGQGTIVWERPASSYTNLAIDSSALYASSDRAFVNARNLRTGDVLWQNEQLEYRRVGAPTVFDDYIVVIDKENFMHLLSKKEGAFAYRKELLGEGFRSPLLVVEDKLLVLSTDGMLESYSIKRLDPNAKPPERKPHLKYLRVRP